ncbi:hypothetical protein BSIN_4815 [Burkholderia singularis]|uniref:Uncharacterized protein n=1 Tax=Burkholderia singularis TaxID=1503053 RepID=A0A238H9Q3_9BURK|nr:hypothetical protein BSIN_4815 [Burkholderia singularis]
MPGISPLQFGIVDMHSQASARRYIARQPAVPHTARSGVFARFRPV